MIGRRTAAWDQQLYEEETIAALCLEIGLGDTGSARIITERGVTQCAIHCLFGVVMQCRRLYQLHSAQHENHQGDEPKLPVL